MNFDRLKVKKWMRLLHRDLGFLMVGFCLVYAVSGILLNHMNGNDPAFKTVQGSRFFPQELSSNELTILWGKMGDLPPLTKVLPESDSQFRLMLKGGIGTYNPQTGKAVYEHHSKRELIYWINKLHYSKVNGWYIMADLFAVSLIVLAISGLFMVSRKYGLTGRGMWYLLAGFAIPVAYVLFS